MTTPVRVRFAPSPTGALHIGGVRTALYNYLFARKHKGTMILRIEDTDQSRFVPGAEEYIKESLEWLGIELDESPWKGGPCAPYRQSERKPMYMQYALQMVAAGHAYYAFDTEEELQAMRERLIAAKVPDPKYNAITRMQMKNSLTMPDDEVQAWLKAGKPFVIRLKVPRKEEIRLQDLIRGWVMVHSATLDDKVLMKSDGMPTYHLANVVDDYLMQVSHVIRGEEWLPSAPVHVLLYKYLGWEAHMPKFAHLPLLLRPDGNGKLSKRDGDLGGYPVFPLQWPDAASNSMFRGFREDGYLPEAVVNFLALLGWNPGTHEELFTMEQLIQSFSIERIGKSGSKFDIQKAKWFNQQYLKAKSDDELGQILQTALTEAGYSISIQKAVAIATILKDRVTFLHEMALDAQTFLNRPTTVDPELKTAKWTEEAQKLVKSTLYQLRSHEDWKSHSLKEIWHHGADQLGVKLGKAMPGVRLALTGMVQGPDLMQSMEIMGKEETLARLEAALHW